MNSIAIFWIQYLFVKLKNLGTMSCVDVVLIWDDTFPGFSKDGYPPKK